MSSNTNPRPALSAENSDRLRRALGISDALQGDAPDADEKLVELRGLLDRCRDGIRRQKPAYTRRRLEAVDQARNFLHFLPGADHPQADGRLQSVSRRLRSALRTS